MLNLWLPPSALFVVVAAIAASCASYFLARRQRWMLAAFAVATAALLVRGYAAADFALHPWDERYHALVAKNLIAQPLTPVLYADPALPYDYHDWTSNHVWLHKPPLSLWAAAASMRIFGVTELSMRLPSVLFSTAAVLVTFGIGQILFSPSVGLVAAGFHAANGFLVDLAAGRRATDHVDTLFILLFEMGVLGALVVAKRRPELIGVTLGVACGFAYLTKSLPALLLFPVWMLISTQCARRATAFKDLAVAGLVAFLIALPWVIHVSTAFPQEWAHENAYSLRHVTEVLEEHGGPPWQYVADMGRYFGELVYVPVLFAIVFVIKDRRWQTHRATLMWVALPYLLFSLMATKMPGYIMIAAPAIFVIQAEFWLWLLRRRVRESIAWRRALLSAAAIVLATLPARHLLSSSGPLEWRERNPEWVRDLRDLNQVIGPEKAVVFNVATPIEAMFYTPYVVYARIPTADDIRIVQDHNYGAYIYEPRTAASAPCVRRVDVDLSAPRCVSD